MEKRTKEFRILYAIASRFSRIIQVVCEFWNEKCFQFIDFEEFDEPFVVPSFGLLI